MVVTSLFHPVRLAALSEPLAAFRCPTNKSAACTTLLIIFVMMHIKLTQRPLASFASCGEPPRTPSTRSIACVASISTCCNLWRLPSLSSALGRAAFPPLAESGPTYLLALTIGPQLFAALNHYKVSRQVPVYSLIPTPPRYSARCC